MGGPSGSPAHAASLRLHMQCGEEASDPEKPASQVEDLAVTRPGVAMEESERQEEVPKEAFRF